MWYVAQVNNGQESMVRDICKQMIDPEILQDCFVPEYETMRKIKGEWRTVRQRLFPGYLFVVTDSISRLLPELKKIPVNVRLLGQRDGNEDILPLSSEEKDWIVAFTDDTHCVCMSEGYIEGETITVTKGPLLGQEAIIKKIDRHKRRAVIEVTMLGRTTTAMIGLEVVHKNV